MTLRFAVAVAVAFAGNYILMTLFPLIIGIPAGILWSAAVFSVEDNVTK